MFVRGGRIPIQCLCEEEESSGINLVLDLLSSSFPANVSSDYRQSTAKHAQEFELGGFVKFVPHPFIDRYG